MRRTLLSALLLLAAALPGRAHDFWIEPADFRPARSEPVALALRVGDFARGEPVARDPRRIVRFSCIGPDGEAAVLGRPGADPAGYARPTAEGVHLCVYESNRASVALPLVKFLGYLDEEGLEALRPAVLARGELTDVRELYSRSCKALVRVGDGPTAGFDRVVGLPLELVPETDPFAASGAGGPTPLSIRLLFRGEPVAGALVSADSLDAGGGSLQVRTNSEGRAMLALPRAGRWLVASTHMVPWTADESAEWESVWASLTFEVPGAAFSARR